MRIRNILKTVGLTVIVVAIFAAGITWLVWLRPPAPPAAAELPYDYPLVTVAEAKRNVNAYSGKNICLFGYYQTGWEYSDIGTSPLSRWGGVWPEFDYPTKAIEKEKSCTEENTVSNCHSWATVCGTFGYAPSTYGHLGGWDYGIIETRAPADIDDLPTPVPSGTWEGLQDVNPTIAGNPPVAPEEADARCWNEPSAFDRNVCYMGFAEGFLDPRFCDRIDPKPFPRQVLTCVEKYMTPYGSYDCRFHETTYVRDRCYYAVAVDTNIYSRLTNDCSPIEDQNLRTVCEEVVAGNRTFADSLEVLFGS